MQLYAAAPARRTRQVLVDLVAVLVVVLLVRLGLRVDDRVGEYAAQVRRTDGAGRELAGNLSGAGDFLGGTPLVGDEISVPFDRAAGAALSLAGAGADSAAAVDRLGGWLGLAVALLPLLVLAPYYLPARIRFVRTASTAQRLLRADPDPELWALRALVRQRPEVLARRVPGAATGWREGDPRVIAALAALELEAVGVAHPRDATPPTRT
jgi:hypothetical protein